MEGNSTNNSNTCTHPNISKVIQCNNSNPLLLVFTPSRIIFTMYLLWPHLHQVYSKGHLKWLHSLYKVNPDLNRSHPNHNRPHPNCLQASLSIDLNCHLEFRFKEPILPLFQINPDCPALSRSKGNPVLKLLLKVFQNCQLGFQFLKVELRINCQSQCPFPGQPLLRMGTIMWPID